jgi:hypothetical protein
LRLPAFFRSHSNPAISDSQCPYKDVSKGHCAAQLLALSSQSSHVDRQSVTIDIKGDP